VLDVATGGGHTALAFAPHVAKVIATDLTPKMLETAEAHLTARGAINVRFELADAESLPFEAETFDLVTCRIAPHHFPDCARFIMQGARVLKPGGLLLVQDYVLPEDDEAARAVDGFERLRDPSHNRSFNENQWRAMFERAGLQIEHSEWIVKRHAFGPWARRQGCTPETIARLIATMQQAPAIAAKWLAPRHWGSAEATFAYRYIIIAGRKAPPRPSVRR
jgi:SAM-dependent methyltransferase